MKPWDLLGSAFTVGEGVSPHQAFGTWVLGDQTQVLVHGRQACYLLSHLPSQPEHYLLHTKIVSTHDKIKDANNDRNSFSLCLQRKCYWIRNFTFKDSPDKALKIRLSFRPNFRLFNPFLKFRTNYLQRLKFGVPVWPDKGSSIKMNHIKAYAQKNYCIITLHLCV